MALPQRSIVDSCLSVHRHCPLVVLLVTHLFFTAKSLTVLRCERLQRLKTVSRNVKANLFTVSDYSLPTHKPHPLIHSLPDLLLLLMQDFPALIFGFIPCCQPCLPLTFPCHLIPGKPTSPPFPTFDLCFVPALLVPVQLWLPVVALPQWYFSIDFPAILPVVSCGFEGLIASPLFIVCKFTMDRQRSIQKKQTSYAITALMYLIYTSICMMGRGFSNTLTETLYKGECVCVVSFNLNLEWDIMKERHGLRGNRERERDLCHYVPHLIIVWVSLCACVCVCVCVRLPHLIKA